MHTKASRNYLSVVIQPVGVSETFLVTNVYDPQKLEDKIKLLEALSVLRSRQTRMPWIMGGDFNVIKSVSEKNGGTRVLNKGSLAFQTFTDNMNLVESDSNNGLFTWNNKRGVEALEVSKLDRFMILEELMFLNSEITAKVLPFGGSDHWSIQLEIKGIDSPRNRPFRLENIWLSHSDFISNIEKWWAEDLQIQGSKMYLLQKSLKHIKFRLKEWNRKDFGNIFRRNNQWKSKF